MRSSRDPLTYLHSLKRLGIRTDPAPLSRVLKRFHHPERDYRSVLIAGSNGKGSIAAMVSSIFVEAGLKTGLYTSPHLTDYRERIRVNGLMISRRDLRELIEKARRGLDEELTYFEFTTLLAFLHFSRCGVDMAVLETGMGGRFDATNLVTPEVCVISNVSLEHREFLGGSLAAIAREKAGIIKKNGICLTAARQKSVWSVLEDICVEREARLYRLGRDILIRKRGERTFSCRGVGRKYNRIDVPLKGRHQMENAALAVGVSEVLHARGLPVAREAVIEGLRTARWEGRLETLRESPTLLVDGAHNPAGIATLCRALARDFSYRRLILVFGVLRDKNYRAMLKKIEPAAHRLILTRPRSERAMPPRELRETVLKDPDHVMVVEDPREALREAFRLAGKKDLICVAGSLYLVGEIKKVFSRMIGMKTTRLKKRQ
jgi:dihydrofolate synthase/folylpolyglutamate synthase